MITYKTSIELFGVARERTLTAVLEHIGDRTLALNIDFNYEEPSGTYTAMNAVRKLDKNGIEVQDIAEGAGDGNSYEWNAVPDFVLQELLNQLERGAVHDYTPEDDE